MVVVVVVVVGGGGGVRDSWYNLVPLNGALFHHVTSPNKFVCCFKFGLGKGAHNIETLLIIL